MPYSTNTIQFQTEIYDVMVAPRSFSTLWLTVDNMVDFMVNRPNSLTDILHIPCLLYFSVEIFSCTSHAGFFLNLGSFSCTSRAGFIFMWGVSLTHPVLAFFKFIFIWGVSLTHPGLALFLSGEFLLHISCLLYFSAGSFSYTSHAGFFFF